MTSLHPRQARGLFPPDALGDLDWISLLTGSDFDLDALNQSLFETAENQTTDAIRNPNEAQGLVQRRDRKSVV